MSRALEHQQRNPEAAALPFEDRLTLLLQHEQTERQSTRLAQRLRWAAGKEPLLPTRKGAFMTRANAAQRLAIAVKHATERRPELAKLTVSPHTIRHYLASLTM